MQYMCIPVFIVLVFLENTLILGDGKEMIIFTFVFIPCILNNVYYIPTYAQISGVNLY